MGNSAIYEYCEKENITILGKLPFDEEFANAYAKGKIFARENNKYDKEFFSLFEKIKSSLKL